MSIDYQGIIENVSTSNPQAIILDGLDEAIIGMSEGSNPIFMYSVEICIAISMRDNEWDYETAVEFLDYNTFNTYYGDYSPKFIYEFTEA
jgi:hypothetical protein|tara:strand:- start:1333 stop:1602 length:270 start_codon:yes stop_codon:yes gene_type:complete